MGEQTSAQLGVIANGHLAAAGASSSSSANWAHSSLIRAHSAAHLGPPEAEGSGGCWAEVGPVER